MALSLSLQADGASSRFFRNPFVANASEGARLVSREWILQSLRALGTKIASRKIPKDEFEDDGPYVGPSGIAYALFRAAKADPQLDLMANAKGILSKQTECSSKVSSSHQCRYLTGTLGFHTIQTIVDSLGTSKHLAEIPTKFRNLLGLVLQEGYQKIGDDEMMNGRAGFLAASIELNAQLGKDILSNEQIAQVLGAMVHSGRQYSKRHGSPANLMYEWHGSEYLGAAHGISGIYQILLSFWDLLDASSKLDVKQSVDWFQSTQFANGNFASSSDRIGKEEKLVHWCHGAPGVLQMLIVAYLVFNEPKYLQSAEKCADLIWTKGILRKGPGLCHGVAGNGYTFLLLYRLTGNEQYLDRAKAFAFVMMSSSFGNSARTPDSPWSLFEGWSGALCFLADLLNPTEAQFPLIPIPFK